MSAYKYPIIFSRQIGAIVYVFSRQMEAIRYLCIFALLVITESSYYLAFFRNKDSCLIYPLFCDQTRACLKHSVMAKF